MESLLLSRISARLLAGPALFLLSVSLPASLFGMSRQGLDGLPDVPSAHTLPSGQMRVGLSAHGHNDASLVGNKTFLLFSPGLASPDTMAINDLQAFTLTAHTAIGLGGHFDLGFSLPWHGDITSDTRAKDLTRHGPGDPSVVARASLGGANPGFFDMALQAIGHIPSKTTGGFLPRDPGYMSLEPLDSLPNTRFFSAGKPWGEVSALTSLDFQKLPLPLPFVLHFGAGYRLFSGPHSSSGWQNQAALQWLATPHLGFFASAVSRSRQSLGQGPQNWNAEYATLSGGLNLRSDEGFLLDIGLHFGQGRSPYASALASVGQDQYRFSVRQQPKAAITVQFGWNFTAFDTDRDGDEIADRMDACPGEAEDKDAFQDNDGCPEIDNDGDLLPDTRDACPLEAEDKDGIQDQDGCIDLDNDRDGVNDEKDQCPLDAEDRDGHVDGDGCPDMDNDEDKILDGQDQCPNRAEDPDGFQDADGCPDPDNDADGIIDSSDKCPDQKESRNNFEDQDGCPDEILGQVLSGDILPRQLILSRVQFQGNTLEMTVDSYKQLDSIAGLWIRYPRVGLEIRAHIDRGDRGDRGSKVGKEADLVKISQARAEKVRAYFLLKGLSPAMVKAVGMGSSQPLTGNATAKGRMENRRIEIRAIP